MSNLQLLCTWMFNANHNWSICCEKRNEFYILPQNFGEVQRYSLSYHMYSWVYVVDYHLYKDWYKVVFIFITMCKVLLNVCFCSSWSRLSGQWHNITCVFILNAPLINLSVKSLNITEKLVDNFCKHFSAGR